MQGGYPQSAAAPMAEIELTLSCKNLLDKDVGSKSDPMVVAFMADFGSNNFREFARTERMENTHNPEFATKVRTNYYFEESQKLKFEVYDCDSNSQKLKEHDFLGRLEITLGEIVGAPGSTVHKQLIDAKGKPQKGGSILIRAEETTAVNKETAELHLHCHKLDNKDTFGKSDPFLSIYRMNRDGSRTLAYRTEVVKNNLSPQFKPFKKSLRELCNGDHRSPIRIECYDYDSDGSHDLIGACETTFEQLAQRAKLSLINPKKTSKKNYKNSGELQVAQCIVRQEHTFLDYVRGGAQIHFTVAVDFTASNGNPADPRSLHYIHPYEPNQYQQALRAVGEICQDYDSDKQFPALGFGARLPTGQVSHEFFLNMHATSPYCLGVDGVLNAYRSALLQCQLYGPTNFSPVIHHVAKFAAAARNDGGHYFVLLIVTDGVITDLEQTKAAIVNASTLPMSIIIIGVGQEDFSAMQFLDADNGRLQAAGRVAARDIVQFVPFRQFQTPNAGYGMTQAKLAKEVLAEVPRQLVEWMSANNFAPRAAINVNAASMPVQPTPPPTQGAGYPPAQAPGTPTPYPNSGGAQQQQQPGAYPSQQQAPGAPMPYPNTGGPQQHPGAYPSQQNAPGGPAPYPTASGGQQPSPGGYMPPANNPQQPQQHGYPQYPGGQMSQGSYPPLQNQFAAMNVQGGGPPAQPPYPQP